MTAEKLEQKLETSKRWLMFFAGVTLVLLAWAITDVPSKFSYFWGYYILWFIFQVTAAATGLVMLVSRSWRELPLVERLDPAFGFLAVAWLLFLEFLIKSNRDEPQPFLWGGSVTLLLYALVLGAGIVLALSYWGLRRTRAQSPEEMFPVIRFAGKSSSPHGTTNGVPHHSPSACNTWTSVPRYITSADLQR